MHPPVGRIYRLTLGRFKLDGQYKPALMKDEPQKARELLHRMEAAEEIRRQDKENLRHHEEQAHAGANTRVP